MQHCVAQAGKRISPDPVQSARKEVILALRAVSWKSRSDGGEGGCVEWWSNWHSSRTARPCRREDLHSGLGTSRHASVMKSDRRWTPFTISQSYWVRSSRFRSSKYYEEVDSAPVPSVVRR